LEVNGTVVEYNISIFNRYGQIVYTSTDLNKAWDGTKNGRPLPEGTYYYIMRSKDNAGKTASQNGYVVIIR
jgi:gliding motility-associated-like protein